MNAKLKEIYENAKIINDDNADMEFDNIYLCSSNKMYKGFWTSVKDFNSFIIIGKKGEEYYKTNYQIDIIEFADPERRISIDIPKELNCFRLYSLGNYYKFKLEILSTTLIRVVKAI